MGDVIIAQLKPINAENREAVTRLSVSSHQRQYIATNEDSLKEAQDNIEVARPFAIYIDDKIVGFTMFAFDENNEDPCDKYWLWRFMIDSSLQQKGYGSAALKEIIKYFRENGADEITLSKIYIISLKYIFLLHKQHHRFHYLM